MRRCTPTAKWHELGAQKLRADWRASTRRGQVAEGYRDRPGRGGWGDRPSGPSERYVRGRAAAQADRSPADHERDQSDE